MTTAVATASTTIGRLSSAASLLPRSGRIVLTSPPHQPFLHKVDGLSTRSVRRGGRGADAGKASAQILQRSSEAATDRIVDVASRQELDSLFQAAAASGDLLVVKYTMAELPNTAHGLGTLQEVAKTMTGAQFVRVFADRGDDLKQVLVDADITRIPSYSVFKHGERVHSATGLNASQLRQLLLFYGDVPQLGAGSVREIDSQEAFHALVESPASGEKLLVVQAACNFCEPCARIFPVFMNLAQRMEGDTVFARFFGDSNSSTEALMREMKVVEAPTFLFFRNGESLGRYVGSAGGDLIGEILKRQGVSVS